MHTRVWWTALAVVALAFAGCADDASGPQEEEDPFQDIEVEATDETGIIRGVVVDPTVTPVADVVISLQGNERTATSNAQGAFAFGDLEPGTYFLTADKVGFNATQASVEVRAGVDDPPVLKIQLVPNPTELPYVASMQFDGFIACSVRGAIIGIALCSLYAGFDDEFDVSYTLDSIPDWVQTEAIWESTQVLGDEMSLSLTCLDGETGCPDGQYEIAQGEGPSPQFAMFGREDAETYGRGAGEDLHIRLFAFGNSNTDVFDEPAVYGTYNSTVPEPVRDVTGKECPEWPVQFDGCVRATGVGLMLDQEFTVFTNVFYRFLPPEDWRFIEDGAIPPPR